MRPGELDDDCMRSAESISAVARESGLVIACAESLTSGAIACHLGAARDATQWFAGGVVAYSSAVKYAVLGVERGPVVTASCAAQMARGVAELTGADFTVAVTGEAGPDAAEDTPVGTVFIGVHRRGQSDGEVRRLELDGSPEEIVGRTTLEALKALHAATDHRRA